jgi:hypothetical protein
VIHVKFYYIYEVKFRDEINYIAFDNLMEEYANVDIELSCLVSNIKTEVVRVF